MSGAPENRCPLCDGDTKATTEDELHTLYRFQCGNCGIFLLDRRFKEMEFGGVQREVKNLRERLSALTREQTIRRLPPQLPYREGGSKPTVPNSYAVDVRHLVESRWPETVTERIDRALMNLRHLSKRGGSTCCLCREACRCCSGAMEQKRTSIMAHSFNKGT